MPGLFAYIPRREMLWEARSMQEGLREAGWILLGQGWRRQVQAHLICLNR